MKATADATARQGIAVAIATKEKINSMGSENYSATIIAEKLRTVLENYFGSMVPSIIIGNSGEGTDANALGQIINLIGLKALSPEFSKIICNSKVDEQSNEQIDAIFQKNLQRCNGESHI